MIQTSGLVACSSSGCFRRCWSIWRWNLWVPAQSAGTGAVCSRRRWGLLESADSPREGRSCSQVSHGELTPESPVSKATIAQAPGQHRDLCMALGEEDERLSSLTRTPTFPLEGQRIESDVALQGKEDPGTGSDTPVTGGVIPGAGRDPLRTPAGAVTSRVPPLSPRQRKEASGNLK